MNEPRQVIVYKTRRKQDMYLFVDQTEDLKRVPESLLAGFGTPEFALSLYLTPDRRLARTDAGKVLSAINSQGFYLQLPLVECDQEPG